MNNLGMTNVEIKQYINKEDDDLKKIPWCFPFWLCK